jgi:hypothetical protein
MKKFHPALVALTIIGSIVIATATRAETQDTEYQGNARYARPYHSQYIYPYHSAHPYGYPYIGYRYARPYYFDTRDSITTATRTPTVICTWVTGTRVPTTTATRECITTATRTPTVIGTWVTDTRVPTTIGTRDSITTATRALMFTDIRPPIITNTRVHTVTDPRPFIIITRRAATDKAPISMF